MPGLIEGPSPLKVEYSLSLPLSLLGTVSLMCAVPEYAGLGEWLDEVRAALPAGLSVELCLLVTFPGRYQRFVEELAATLPTDTTGWDFNRLLAHLQALSADEYQRLALAALGKGLPERPDGAQLLAVTRQPAEWAATVTAAGSTFAPETVAGVICDGQALKERLITALQEFWRLAYAAEYDATRPVMERSVSQNKSRRSGADFRETFGTVTGRRLPEPVAALLPAIDTVTFVPSCYVGPYVAYWQHHGSLILFYNCRSAAPQAAALPTLPTGALYPPLKALADETRLQILALLRGRELYAQEIVNLLDISQPAVSRHLNLMVAAGVLKIRREGNAKYYAVNSETLGELSAALARLV